MQEAILPDDEASRVAALHSLDILDTPREDRFDRYTRIAARAFNVPIALISLVDRDRQWIKSAEGFDARETPRAASFCAHAILHEGVFEVQNARWDLRFRDNPLVLNTPCICFYAGAPIRTSDGHVLGTLCIIDRLPRQLSDDDKTKLQRIANMVADEISREAGAGNGRVDRDLKTISGAEFFDNIPEEPGLSVLLFDIDDVLSSHDEMRPDLSPGEIFADLLHDHFPGAESIVHIGNYHFCVLLRVNRAFDEVRAISRVCAAAKDLLCFAEGHDFLTPFVGRIEYSSSRYASVSDVLRDAEGMFFRHERQFPRRRPDIKRFLKSLVGWRKTIF